MNRKSLRERSEDKSPLKTKDKKSLLPIYIDPVRITEMYKRRLQNQYNESWKWLNFGNKVKGDGKYTAPVKIDNTR